MDKLHAMRTFVEIVDAGSLTAAADVLDSSLPAVVRTLAALEDELGIRLLNRTTRRQSLTEEGRRYLEHSRRILQAVRDAELDIQAEQTEPSGPLVLTAPIMFGQMYVAPIVTRFARRHAAVRCRVLLLDRVVNLLEEGIDLSVRIGHLADSSLIALPVGHIRRVVVASPACLRRHGMPRVPEDLKRMDCVQVVGGTARGFIFNNKGVRLDVPVAGNLEFNQIAPAIDACADGAGFGSFLSYQVAPLVASRRLKIVLAEFEEAAHPVSIIYPQGRPLPSRTRLMIDALKRELREGLSGAALE
jgi:DNA-binding transcriptional LysR family regulator